MERGRWRCDMFQIAECAARCESVVDLGVKSAFAGVCAVMDCKARHDNIESLVIGKWIIKIVFADDDTRIVRKPGGCCR